MGSSLMAAGPATGPVAVMEQTSQQANNMYYRGKNAMDDKVGTDFCTTLQLINDILTYSTTILN